MASALLRQWLILSLLPKRPRRIDTGSIESHLRARGVEVHRRTIQRDLIDLAEVFPIVADDRAKPFGWRWSDDASFCGQLPFPSPIPKPTDTTVEVLLRVPRASVAALRERVTSIEGVEVLTPAC